MSIDQRRKHDLKKKTKKHMAELEKQGLPAMNGLTTDFQGQLMFS